MGRSVDLLIGFVALLPTAFDQSQHIFQLFFRLGCFLASQRVCGVGVSRPRDDVGRYPNDTKFVVLFQPVIGIAEESFFIPRRGYVTYRY